MGIRTILFPVDLSDVSPKLVPWVLQLADKFEAEVHIIFVAQGLAHYAGLYVPYPIIAEFENEVLIGAEKRLEQFADDNFKGRQVMWQIISGDPAEQILQYAESKEIDLIIMGTHGRKGLERIIFGSVAGHVVKNSPVPVLTVNPYRMTVP